MLIGWWGLTYPWINKEFLKSQRFRFFSRVSSDTKDFHKSFFGFLFTWLISICVICFPPPVFAFQLTCECSLTRCEHSDLSEVWDRQVLGVTSASCGLAPVSSNDGRTVWGSGRRRHFSSVCHPGWQLVEKPPLGVFVAPRTPTCLPACTTTWCSRNTQGICRLIFYLSLAYTHIAPVLLKI